MDAIDGGTAPKRRFYRVSRFSKEVQAALESGAPKVAYPARWIATLEATVTDVRRRNMRAGDLLRVVLDADPTLPVSAHLREQIRAWLDADPYPRL